MGYFTALPKASRNTDPDTSHEAEEQMTRSQARQRQMGMVLDYVRMHPGSTYGELAKYSQVPDRNLFSRRLNDLWVKDMVIKGEKRKCLVGGKNCQTWTAQTEQQELF